MLDQFLSFLWPKMASALTITIALFSAGHAHGGESAEEIVERFRSALGPTDVVSAVSGLQAKGTFRRKTDTDDVAGDIELRFVLPNLLVKQHHVDIGTGMITSWLYDGSTTRRLYNGRSVSTAGHHLAGDVARFATLLLAAPPLDAPGPSVGGLVESPEGNAHRLDFVDPDGRAFQMYISTESNLPLLLTYRGKLMPAGGVALVYREGGQRREIRDGKGVYTEAEIGIHPDDYRAVDSLFLPHRITFSLDGEAREEWEIDYELNPPLKPEDF